MKETYLIALTNYEVLVSYKKLQYTLNKIDNLSFICLNQELSTIAVFEAYFNENINEFLIEENRNFSAVYFSLKNFAYKIELHGHMTELKKKKLYVHIVIFIFIIYLL